MSAWFGYAGAKVINYSQLSRYKSQKHHKLFKNMLMLTFEQLKIYNCDIPIFVNFHQSERFSIFFCIFAKTFVKWLEKK